MQYLRNPPKDLKKFFPLLYWVLDHAGIDIFKVGSQSRSYKSDYHLQVCKTHMIELLAYSSASKEQREAMKLRTARAGLNSSISHALVKVNERKISVWCSHLNRTKVEGKKGYLELSINATNALLIYVPQGHVFRIFMLQC